VAKKPLGRDGPGAALVGLEGVSDDELAAARYGIRIVGASEGRGVLGTVFQWVLMLFGQADGGSYKPTQDVEIIERGTERVAFRDAALWSDGAALAAQTLQGDLDAMIVEDFEAKWSPLRVIEP